MDSSLTKYFPVLTPPSFQVILHSRGRVVLSKCGGSLRTLVSSLWIKGYFWWYVNKLDNPLDYSLIGVECMYNIYLCIMMYINTNVSTFINCCEYAYKWMKIIQVRYPNALHSLGWVLGNSIIHSGLCGGCHISILRVGVWQFYWYQSPLNMSPVDVGKGINAWGIGYKFALIVKFLL